MQKLLNGEESKPWDENDFSPLHFAAVRGHDKALEAIIKYPFVEINDEV